MKFVVTGATGFVGRALCEKLLEEGHEVTALTRDAAGSQQKLGARITALAWGNPSETAWKQAVGTADAVVHLAGESVGGQRWTEDFKRKILNSRVETTRAIVDAIGQAESKPAVLVSASAVGFYGDCGDAIVTEETPPANDFLGTVCQQWEAEVKRVAAFGVRETRMRIGIVLGQGGALEKMLRPLPVPFSPWQFGLGGPMGSGRQWLPWIHLDDVVGLFYRAATDAEWHGPINTAAPNPVTNAEFAHAIGRILHRPAVLPIPGLVLKIMLGEFAEALLGGQRAIPQAAEKWGYRFAYADVNAALRSLLQK